VLESKEQLKARGIDSPDMADALACTFTLPVSCTARKFRPELMQPDPLPFAWG
jgi:hypothetical protein